MSIDENQIEAAALQLAAAVQGEACREASQELGCAQRRRSRSNVGRRGAAPGCRTGRRQRAGGAGRRSAKGRQGEAAVIRRASFHRLAQLEILEASGYYAEVGDGLGAEFLDEVDWVCRLT